MQQIPNIKRGDTLEFLVGLTDEQGSTMTGITDSLRSEVRDERDKLISEMVITETEIPGQYLFRAPDTSSWPTGCYLYMDIQYESDGVKSSSEIIRMVVERDAKYTIWR